MTSRNCRYDCRANTGPAPSWRGHNCWSTRMGRLGAMKYNLKARSLRAGIHTPGRPPQAGQSPVGYAPLYRKAAVTVAGGRSPAEGRAERSERAIAGRRGGPGRPACESRPSYGYAAPIRDATPEIRAVAAAPAAQARCCCCRRPVAAARECAPRAGGGLSEAAGLRLPSASNRGPSRLGQCVPRRRSESAPAVRVGWSRPWRRPGQQRRFDHPVNTGRPAGLLGG